jgi:signal transduction histidine kinase
MRWWAYLVLAWLLMGVGLVHGQESGQIWQVDRAERVPGIVTDVASAQPRLTWQTVSLPDSWRLDGRSGTWRAGVGGACLNPHPGVALWIPRVGSSLALWINGQPVVRLADVHGHEVDRGQRPILVTFAPSMLREARSGLDNDVRLVVSSPSPRLAGLSRVWLGADASLSERHELRDVFLIGSAVSTLSTSVLLTLAGLWVAWRIQSEAWLFAMVSLLWGLRECLWLTGPSIMPWDLAALLGDLVSGAAVLVACLTLPPLLGESAPMWCRLIMGAQALLPGLIWWRATHSTAGADELVLGWFFMAHALGLWGIVIIVRSLWRKPSWPTALILLGCLGAAVIAGIENWHDKQSLDPLSFEHLRLAPLMALCALFAVCVCVYVRVSVALALEGRHKEALQSEVTAQRMELEALHARERARAQTEAVIDERARIVRDMHDGLGSQLVGMLSTVESGAFTRDELLDELSEALNQLRLTIDSLEPIGEDLSSLLGQLRYRLDARLRKAGFKVMWDVTPLPADAQLSATHINHLQRLLYETFSNVIKHSGGASVWVHASHDEASGTNRIVIRDDGCGFETGRPGGRGLSNLAHRAAQLGADLDVRSHPGQGTQVSLSWTVGAL